MKAFIVFSVVLALASAGAVDSSNKEKRGLWELGSAQHDSYESYGYDHQQSHGYYGNDYVQKEVKQVITKKVPVPYPVEVPVTVHIKEHHKKPFWG
uniref:Uncharacterized protein n=1 Tax=Anopheles arabiensis TaxID=7173 RepID=A0A2C9GQW7_ANOAR